MQSSVTEYLLQQLTKLLMLVIIIIFNYCKSRRHIIIIIMKHEHELMFFATKSSNFRFQTSPSPKNVNSPTPKCSAHDTCMPIYRPLSLYLWGISVKCKPPSANRQKREQVHISYSFVLRN